MFKKEKTLFELVGGLEELVGKLRKIEGVEVEMEYDDQAIEITNVSKAGLVGISIYKNREGYVSESEIYLNRPLSEIIDLYGFNGYSFHDPDALVINFEIDEEDEE